MFSNYTASKYNPKEFDYSLPAEGVYTVNILEVNPPKEPKFGEEKVVIKLLIIGGEYNGKFIFDSLYSLHRSNALVNISKHRLNGYCAALCKPKLTSITDLIGGYLKIVYKHRKVDDKVYGDIKEYMPLSKEEQESIFADEKDIPF